MGLAALLKGWVSRQPPNRMADNQPQTVRLASDGSVYVVPRFRKQYAHGDEGGYYVVNNAQSGLATGTAATWATTTPTATIYNTETDVANGKSIYLDYLGLTTTAAGSWASAGVNVQFAVYLDTGDRYTSGGTDLTSLIVNTNMRVGKSSIAKVRFGAITAAAASAQRSIIGLRTLRPAVSATVPDVVGEFKMLNFGGVEAALNGSITVAAANMISSPCPGIIIAPNSSALIYLVFNGTTVGAPSYMPEFGWIEA